MRRGIFTNKERDLRNRIRTEHDLFKYKMLAMPAKDIYECCIRIRFYECIYEYFEYCGDISEEIIDACLKEYNILEVLWNTYLHNEYLKYDTWDDISELVMVMLQRQK